MPQGAILSPLLFNLYCADIPQCAEDIIAQYADDTALLAQDEDLHEAIRKLQDNINLVSSWFRKWKLQLNPSKTEAKIFALRHFNLLGLTTLRLDGLPVPWNPKDQAVRYLGVHLDTRLTWRLHTNNSLRQANARLQLLYPLINRKSTLRHECALLIYKTMLRPLLTYSCPVWFSASKSTKYRLQTFQNRFLRMAVNAPWFVRNSQIHRELGVPRLDEVLTNLTRRHHERLPLTSGALEYHLGTPIAHRLKPRTYQDLLEL